METAVWVSTREGRERCHHRAGEDDGRAGEDGGPVYARGARETGTDVEESRETR